MPYYSVNLLLKSEHLREPAVNPLWEERIVLVEAASERDAVREGMRIGKEAEDEYTVSYGGDEEGEEGQDTLRWTFVQIERVCEISNGEIKNGTELFSRFLRESEIRSILSPFEG
ncbi:MAG: hypothetical protein A4E73_00892 [Syntrophaceae bacterium PtaU1.Bin231]|jgi:hypothetical protein|nr:MAG: hypothetical protein A4E73_00892 [Syntrophaceae bacterium PtaU1.Bin231]